MSKTFVLVGALVALAFAHTAFGYGGQNCAPEAVHAYNIPFASNGHARTEAGLLGSGAVTVWDSDLLGACNGNGIPAQFDGDLDMGLNGGFFGSATTWEGACGYGFNVHATTGNATDAVVPIVVGIYAVDDVGNGAGCNPDGIITPGVGGDCVSAWVKAWSPGACADAGADDGYWLFLSAPVTTGILTADF